MQCCMSFSRSDHPSRQSSRQHNVATRKFATGFPSPADDYADIGIDLNKELIHHPTSTFFLRANGTALTMSGIHDGDLLIVDRSIDPKPGQIVVTAIDGLFAIKRLTHYLGVLRLETDDPEQTPIEINKDKEFYIWGIAIYSIHSLR